MYIHIYPQLTVCGTPWSFLSDVVACCVCLSGFTLVVTPLVSLMEDQVMYLKATNVKAAMLNASSSKVGIGCSPGHFDTWSPGHLVTWSLCHLFTWSL